MSDVSQSGSSKDTPGWFAGDRRLFCLVGPLPRDHADNPEQLIAGCGVRLPRSIRAALKIDEHLKFTLTEVRSYGFGSMGFCEVDGQPGEVPGSGCIT